MIEIGPKIKEVMDSKGMSHSEFARRINKSRETTYDILRRKTMDTGLLMSISLVLDHDFFQYYTPLKDKVEALEKELYIFKKIVERL